MGTSSHSYWKWSCILTARSAILLAAGTQHILANQGNSHCHFVVGMATKALCVATGEHFQNCTTGKHGGWKCNHRNLFASLLIVQIGHTYRLARIAQVASHIVGCELPTLDSLYRARVVKKAQSIMSDPGHLAHQLFEMLPLGRRLRALKSGSKCTHDSF